MLEQEKAAEYFIVAWIKSWSLQTYLKVCGEGERIEWGDAHNIYRWLPDDPGFFMRNVYVKRYMDCAFPSLNNKLWDAPDNAARLKLANHILKADGAGAKQTTDKARLEERKNNKKYQASRLEARLSIEQARRGYGTHWKVVK